MVTLARRAQHVPFAPVVAVLFGVVAAILVAAVPQWMFEAGVVKSGLPTVLAASAPPLGLVARLLAIALAGGTVALLTWILLAPLARILEAKARARTPWRDAGYDGATTGRDAPIAPRRPIFAPDELGAPLMSDEAIASVLPVADVDPDLAAPLLPDTLEVAVVAPASAESSIAALIRRLEDGLSRRAANDGGPDGSGGAAIALSRSWIVPGNVDASPLAADDDENTLRQALGSLRRMARG